MADIKLSQMHEGLIDLLDYLSLVGLSDETRESLINQIEEYALSAVRENAEKLAKSYLSGTCTGNFAKDGKIVLNYSKGSDAEIAFECITDMINSMLNAAPDSEGGKP